MRIPKGQSEAINRRTDYTMTERKTTKAHKLSTQKLEQHEHHCKLEVKSGASDGSAVYVPLVTPAMLLLLQTRMKKEPDCGYDKRICPW